MSSVWRLFFDAGIRPLLSTEISAVALGCLVFLWAATSHVHWFWRALAVWSVVMLMVPIRAWEPAWLFGLSAPLILVLIALGHRLDRRWTPEPPPPAGETRQRYRFSVRDLLLLTFIVGLWLPGTLQTIRHWQPKNWLGWIVSSASIAVLASAAYACARMPRRWPYAGLLALGIVEVLGGIWVEFPTLAVIAVAAGMAAYFYAFDRRHWLAMLLLAVSLPACAAAMLSAGQWMRWHTVIGGPGGKYFAVLLLVELSFVIIVVAVVGLARIASNQERAALWRAAAGVTCAVVIAVPVARLGDVYWRMLAATPRETVPKRFEATTNQYAQLLPVAKAIEALDRAGQMTVVNSKSVWVQRSTKATPALEALYDRLFPLLQAPSAVPYDPAIDANALYDQRKWPEIQAWRALCRSLEAEASVAAAAGDNDRAAKFALAIVRIGDMLGRGGLSVDSLVAHGLRRVGYAELIKIRDKLNETSLRTVRDILRQSIAEREDPAAMLARQAHHDDQVLGWNERLNAAVMEGGANDQEANVRLEITWGQFDETMVRLLDADLAIRLFRAEQGRLPVSLEELVPAYFDSPPRDPYSQPLRYRTEGQQFVLYSAGWDRKDDGGTFASFNRYMASIPRSDPVPPGWRAPIDFDLDSVTRPEPPEPPAEEPPATAPPLE